MPEYIKAGGFLFAKKAPERLRGAWHSDMLDHTNHSQDGYVYLIDGGISGSQIFNTTINHLCTGKRYEFSAYITNVVKNTHNAPKPNIRFEVRTALHKNHLIAQKDTSEISESPKIEWKRYGLSFITYTESVVLLMILKTGDGRGNDFAIDDIQLRPYYQSHSPG